jgi:hypothetical protein
MQAGSANGNRRVEIPSLMFFVGRAVRADPEATSMKVPGLTSAPTAVTHCKTSAPGTASQRRSGLKQSAKHLGCNVRPRGVCHETKTRSDIRSRRVC